MHNPGRLILLAILMFAVVWGASLVHGASGDCPGASDPLPSELHDVVVQAETAEKTAGPAEAAKILDAYLKAHPEANHAYPFYDLGYFLHRAGDSGKAEAPLRKALRLDPCLAEAWQLLAVVHQEAGAWKSAARAMERAAAITDDPRMREQSAVLHLQAGEPKTALKRLAQLRREGHASVDGHLACAQAHADLEEPARAAAAMAEAHRLSEEPEHLYQCAVFWLEAENPKEALPLLERLSQGPSPRSEWLVALSKTLKALHRKEETAAAMERAARRGRDPNLYFHAAYLWLEADRPEKALPLLERLAKRRKPEADWLLGLVNTYMALDRTVAAAKTMDRLARAHPEPRYQYNAGVLWLQATQPRKALAHLIPLCRRTPPEADWFVALAHARTATGETRKAAAAMERAAQISGRADYAYTAGGLWLQAKDPDAAIRVLSPLAKRSHPKAEWLVAISNAWMLKENYEIAAKAMEHAARISKDPEHIYSAGGLWLRADRPKSALPHFQALAKRSEPQAQWLVALSETWRRLEEPAKAASAMERAAQISGKNEHRFRAARLWVEADRPQRALPLLETLAALPEPKGEWLVTLSNVYRLLEEPLKAAQSMERAARITGKGEYYYQAGVLWMEAEELSEAVRVLNTAVNTPPVQPLWQVTLARVLVDLERPKEAGKVLDQTNLQSGKIRPDVRYQGAALWLRLGFPQKALPILEGICKSSDFAFEWGRSLVKTYVELDRFGDAQKTLDRVLNRFPENPEAWQIAVWVGLQEGNFIKAAAAMAVAGKLSTPDAKTLGRLGELYQMAGVPVKAAEAFERSWAGTPSGADWDRVVNTLLSGHRYEMALAPARSAAAAEPTAKRWETLGDIAFRLRRFEESLAAYRRAGRLSSQANCFLKAGLAALKLEDFPTAAEFLEKAMAQSPKTSRVFQTARRHLAFIHKMTDFLQRQAETRSTP